MKRCLLIAPLSFYAFHKDLGQALTRAGYSVAMLNEEYPDTTLGKIMGKLALARLRKSTLAELKNRLPGMGHFDLVVIVKGRGLGPQALELLRQHADRIVGYNFDSFRFNPSPRDWLHLCDRYCTFDIADSEATGLPLVHLFSAATRAPEDTRDTDLSVVMKIHSDRLAYVDRVLAALPEGCRSYVFLYAPNWFEVVKQALRAPGPMWRLRRFISFAPLSYDDAMAAIARSYATLDYAHPLQSGITVRCYEAQSLRVAVVTNNPYVARAGVFTEGAVATFGLEDDPATLGPLLERLRQTRITPTRRDTDTFVADLLSDTLAQIEQRDTA